MRRLSRLIWPSGSLTTGFAAAVLLLALVLSVGCATGPLTPAMELARATSAARVVYEQATEARLDGFISDDVWACIKQLQPAVDAALDAGDVGLAQRQTRLLRRAARENFDACE